MLVLEVCKIKRNALMCKTILTNGATAIIDAIIFLDCLKKLGKASEYERGTAMKELINCRPEAKRFRKEFKKMLVPGSVSADLYGN